MTPTVDYPDLSRRYAARGESRLAPLAAWAGDVHALEALVWDSGLDRAPDPAGELRAVGEVVADAVTAAAGRLPDGARVSLRAVVEAAREAMVATFDSSVHELLREGLALLDHLDAPAPASEASAPERSADRLAGRTPDGLVAELRLAAGDCATMAGLLAAGGEHDAAGRLARQADAATFEAYLVTAAVAADDHGLATVDLRWDLAKDDAAPVERERLLAVLGSAERDALRRTFEPTGPSA